MVNMYSMGMMGGLGGSGNVYQNLKSKYGVGYEDEALTPKPFTYSMSVKPKRPEVDLPQNFWQRIFKAYYI